MDDPDDSSPVNQPEKTVDVHGMLDGPERAVQVSMDGLSGLLYAFAESTIHMDPNGDVDLVIGLDSKLRTFRISSAAMLGASPVWRTMLTTGFKESHTPLDPITFPEDDVLSFFVLLLATHLRFPEIPRQVGLKQFEDICVLCDKYDCIVILQPLIESWKTDLKFRSTHVYKPEEYRSWAWIGWATGDEAVIREVKDYYILNSRTNSSKELLDTDIGVLDGGLPPGLIDTIHEGRRHALTHFVKGCAEMVNQWCATQSKPRCGTLAHNKEQCDALYLGHLVKTVRKWKLWPGATQRLVSGLEARSIKDTSTSLKRIRAPVYQKLSGFTGISQEQFCGWTKEFYSLIDCELEERAHEAIEASVPHLEVQRLKLQPKTISLSRFQRSASHKESQQTT